MLTSLLLRDFVLIEAAELALADRFTVITGETGAGKSILIDALQLALGERADTALVRAGSAQTEIDAGFELASVPAGTQWLRERELIGEPAGGAGGNGQSPAEECWLRRVLGQDGRSRAYINGRPLPAQSLRELGGVLVDIHGQHAHQSLLRGEQQLRLLDHHAGLLERRTLLGECWRRWQTLQRALADRHTAEQQRAARMAWLVEQLADLDALALAAGEWELLEQEQRRLAHSDRLVQGVQALSEALYTGDADNMQQRVARCQHELDALAALDPRLAPVQELLAGALIALEEAGQGLARHAQALEQDPGRLEWVEQRMERLHARSRRHRVAPGELAALTENWREELDALAASAEQAAGLDQACAAAEREFRALAEQASQRRHFAARQLGESISAVMADLGMPGGRLEFSLHTDPEAAGPQGYDRVEIEVSANPGQPLRPLARVASGGELSRISLAIQVLGAQASAVPTLIFDEVDAGIGGAVAEIVGRRLREVAAVRQVLCVTHLPQVAAQAQAQFAVRKSVRGGRTRTEIRLLDPEERIEELARMLGGVELTRNTRAHARELLERAQAAG